MNLVMLNRGGAPLLLALATACGGDGHSQSPALPPTVSSPTTSPPPPPSPTPVPTPTPAPLGGPAAIEQVGEFAVLGYAKSYTTRPDGSDTQDFAEYFEGTRFRFLASGIHELLVPTSEWSPLGKATRTGSSPFSSLPVVEPTGQKGFLALMLIPKTAELALSHTGFGTWYVNQGTILANGRILQLAGGLAYGVATVPDRLPVAGTKTYKGFGDLEGYGVSSPLELIVDFATGKLTGTITPTFSEFGGGERPVGPYSFTGSIAGGTSSTAVDVALPNGKTGRIEIVFTGPVGEEMMVRFRGTIPCLHISEAGCSLVMPGAAIQS